MRVPFCFFVLAHSIHWIISTSSVHSPSLSSFLCWNYGILGIFASGIFLLKGKFMSLSLILHCLLYFFHLSRLGKSSKGMTL